MAYNPRANFWVAEVVRGKFRINPAFTEPNLQTSGPAEPTFLFSLHEGPAFYITAPTVDDVTNTNTVPTQSLGIGLTDAGNSILYDAVVTDIDRHD
jgi:hypothetical protein